MSIIFLMSELGIRVMCYEYDFSQYSAKYII